MIDNNPIVTRFHPFNSLIVHDLNQTILRSIDYEDTELLELIPFLKKLASANDVRPMIRWWRAKNSPRINESAV